MFYLRFLGLVYELVIFSILRLIVIIGMKIYIDKYIGILN